MPADVRATGVVKRYGSVPALNGVDLHMRGGELLALLGPSGSGKTTLLRVIAGLEVPNAGRVFFGDADVTDHPVQRRGIGFVFQNYALFRHLNVFDNIAYGPRTRGRQAPARLRAKVLELLELVQLPGLEKRYPGELSGGQRQRVALARALAVEPTLLLLDEPFGALDARVRKDLRRWLRDIHRRTGQSTIFVTHDQEEALELADRVAVLNQGHIEQVGTPAAIVDDPASAFVMGFVGENLSVPVTVQNGMTFRSGRPLDVAAPGLADGPADLVIRNVDLVVSSAPTPLTGIVTHARRVAGASWVDVSLPEVGARIDIPVGSAEVAVGQTVFLATRRARVFARRGPANGNPIT